jgi:hypothetical protein
LIDGSSFSTNAELSAFDWNWRDSRTAAEASGSRKRMVVLIVALEKQKTMIEQKDFEIALIQV